MIRFEWNAVKAASNFKKHGVSFEEAQTVFYDEFAVQFFDEDHAETEDRFLMLGMSINANLLMICHCEKDEEKDEGKGKEHTIRLISARKATKNESKFYLRGA